MTTAGIVLLVCIITVFAIFSAGLAWGVRQSTVALREGSKSGGVALEPGPSSAHSLQDRAA